MLRLILVSLLAVQKSFCAELTEFKPTKYETEELSEIDDSPACINDLNLSASGTGGIVNGLYSEPVLVKSNLYHSSNERVSSITPFLEVINNLGDFESKEIYSHSLRNSSSPKVEVENFSLHESENSFEEIEADQKETEGTGDEETRKFKELISKNNDIFKNIKQNVKEIVNETKDKVTAELEASLQKVLFKPVAAAAVVVETVEYDSGDDEEEEEAALTAFQFMSRANAEAAEAEAKEAEIKAKEDQAATALAEYREGKDFTDDLMSYNTLESIAELSPYGRSKLSIALAVFLHDMKNSKTAMKLSDVPASLLLFQVSKIMFRIRKSHLSVDELACADVLLQAIQGCEIRMALDLLPMIEYLLRAGSAGNAEAMTVGNALIDLNIIPHIYSLENSVNRMGIFIEYIARNGYFLLLKDLISNASTGPMILSHLNMEDVKFILCSFMGSGVVKGSEAVEMVTLITREIGLVSDEELAKCGNEKRDVDFSELK